MTPKQYQLFSFIRNRIAHFGKAPTFTEMKEYMGVSSNQTIGDWLAILEREGYIAKDKGLLRGLSITKRGMSGFDEGMQLQDPKALKTAFTPVYSASSSGVSVFNTGPEDSGKTVHLDAKNRIPMWKGGEKSGSS